MKVTDDELLAAVWRRMVIGTARGTVTRYVGGKIGLAGNDMRSYGQDIHIIDRERLGIPLSSGHLRKRLIALVEAGLLRWVVRDCTFWLDCMRGLDVWRRASDWWSAKGVPGGYEKGQGMRTVRLENFDSLVKQLETELLAEFGEYRTQEHAP
ncbi:hypothetical protein D3C76_507940 [compost metagenome]